MRRCGTESHDCNDDDDCHKDFGNVCLPFSTATKERKESKLKLEVMDNGFGLWS